MNWSSKFCMRWSKLQTFWIGQGHLKYRPGSVMGAGRLAEGGDDGDFGGADLEDEQQQAEDQDQQQADDEGQWIAFHGNYLGLGAGTLRLSRLCAMDSCRSNVRTSCVLVVSKTYLRALAVARAKVCR